MVDRDVRRQATPPSPPMPTRSASIGGSAPTSVPRSPGDLGDRLARLDHHLHRLSLELRAEPPALLGHGHIISIEGTCPRSLVHLRPAPTTAARRRSVRYLRKRDS